MSIRPPKAEGKKSFQEQVAEEGAKLQASESARRTDAQAPYDEATIEGDMETAGEWRAAKPEAGDVPALETPRIWQNKTGTVKLNLDALGLSEADIVELEPGQAAAALKPELDPADVVDEEYVDEVMSDEEILAAQEAAATKGYGPEAAAAAHEAVEEIQAMPEEKKKRTLNGIVNLGAFASEWKSEKMASLIGSAESKTDQGSAMNRLLAATREYYQRRAESSRKLIERNDKMLSVSGTLTNASKVGSILSWGRVGLDIVGHGAFAKQLNPFRHMTAAAMAFGTGAEIGKEMRLKNTDVRTLTRIEDAEAAEDEARALYEEAKKKAGGEVTAEALSASYKERLPQDLLKRIQENPDGFATSFVSKVFKKDLAWGVERIQKNLDKIDADPKLTDEQKAAKRQRVLAGAEGFLRDADRMLTRSAGVDAAAYSARLVEKGAKAFVTVMAVDTMARLFTSAHDLFDQHFGQPENAFRGLPATAMAGGTVESFIAPEPELMTAESPELPPGIVSLETVGAGGSITGSLMKQLEEHPEKFGYEGNAARDSEQLHAWAFKTAKAMAKEAGFLTRKDQQDSWLSAAAVGKLQIGVNMEGGKPSLAFVDHNGAVLSAADIKAGRYEMPVPFPDAGEEPAKESPVPPVLSPEQRPSFAQDYYVNKLLGAKAGELTNAQKRDLGGLLFRLKHYETLMRDEGAEAGSRATARTEAAKLLKTIAEKHAGILKPGWTEKMHAMPSYTAFVQMDGKGKEFVGPPAPPVEAKPSVDEVVEEEKPKAPPVPKPRKVVMPAAEEAPVKVPKAPPVPARSESEVPVADLVPKEPEAGPAGKLEEYFAPSYAELPERGAVISKKTFSAIVEQMRSAAAERDRAPAGSSMRKAAEEYLAETRKTVQGSFGKYLKPGWYEAATTQEKPAAPAVEEAVAPRRVRRVVSAQEAPAPAPAPIVRRETTEFSDDEGMIKGREEKTETYIDVSSWTIQEVEDKLKEARVMLAGQEARLAKSPGNYAVRAAVDLSKRVIADLERSLAQKKES